ncbi:aldo/keto reductase [Enteractinococcus fodinae]|uniref:Aryl-alcohol dehydrogenase-like predicted oxidoreductase n=1 Tax=Enteractinococcus fodinae TaxID=684663 RepID=A0ABU2B322_9MICC|nr:aldo/keto reductase [Enteractinococcus fodinae]MDR7348008.1 aryl-alcohol dehydrogenase-like predicted oxidoreductase [Enteractinococcus fodinae]
MADKQLINPDVPLALGGNTFGWTSSEDDTFAVLDAFLDAGGAHVDTADSYSQWAPGNSGGESEAILGNYFAARGNRDKVFLATKVAGWEEQPGLTPENVNEAVEASLARLQTDYIDLYYAHYDDESQSPQQLARTFDALVKDGKVRHIGLSNLSPERQAAWIAAAQEGGLTVPAAIQPNYSLAHRSDVEGTDGYGELAEQHNLAVFPYYSLAAGLLTGKYQSLEDFEGSDRAGQLAQFANEDALDLVGALVGISEELDHEPASVALAWLLAKDVTAPIASARVPEQLDALIAASDVRLYPEHVARLDEASQKFL